METKRKCPVCGEVIFGRIDKKFCSDQCRTEFNNRNNRDSNSYIRRINSILRKNRRILEMLNPSGKTKVSRSTLVDHGFNFNFFTSVYTTNAGKKYYFCYDQGYLQLPDDFYVLVRRE